MKKDNVRGWIVLAAVLIVYNVVAFAAPFPKNAVFFLSWIFTLLAIAAQAYIMQTAFRRGSDAKSKFYGFPIAKIGVMYLAAQLVAGLVFMALGLAVKVPLWIPLILYVLLLGTSAVGLVAADVTRNEIERQDVKLKKDVTVMRALQSKAASLPGLTQDSELARVLEKFAEEVRFSDPVSSEGLGDIEADLTACVDELQQAVVDGDREAALTLEKKARSVLTERNRLCKLKK